LTCTATGGDSCASGEVKQRTESMQKQGRLRTKFVAASRTPAAVCGKRGHDERALPRDGRSLSSSMALRTKMEAASANRWKREGRSGYSVGYYASYRGTRLANQIKENRTGVGSHRVGVQLDYEPEVGDTADERPPLVSEMREGEARLPRLWAGPSNATRKEKGSGPLVQKRRSRPAKRASRPPGKKVSCFYFFPSSFFSSFIYFPKPFSNIIF
jgi:hypothetical protein